MLRKLAAVAATACTLTATASPPVHAAGPTAQVLSVAGPGCASGVFLMRARFDGIDPAAPVVVHTIVRGGGLVYMDDSVTLQTNVPDTLWRLFDSFNYGDVPNRGTWPISQNLPVRVEVRMERPKGTVLTSWSLSVDSCNQAKILYNGLTANDRDAHTGGRFLEVRPEQRHHHRLHEQRPGQCDREHDAQRENGQFSHDVSSIEVRQKSIVNRGVSPRLWPGTSGCWAPGGSERAG